MTSVSKDQCKQLLIYNHDNLSDLDIKINSKKIVFGYFLSSKFLDKLCMEKLVGPRHTRNPSPLRNF
eukprot:UN13649